MARRFRLRTIVALLVLATTLPLGLFAGWLIWSSWRQQQTLVDQQNIEQARAVRVAVEQEIERTVVALNVLSELNPTSDPNHTHFLEIVQRMLPLNPGWESVRLVDPSLRVLADTAVPGGDVPLVLDDPGWVRDVIVTKRPSVSDVHRSSTSGAWIVSVGVPVSRGGKLRYVLGARLRASTFGEILRRQKVPNGGVVTLLDSDQKVVARSRGEAALVGRSPTADFAERSRSAAEGSWRTTLLEGNAAYSAWSRSTPSGWTVGVGLPTEAVDRPMVRSLLALSAVGFGILGAGIGVVVLLGRGIVRTQRRASRSARLLAQGEPVPAMGSRIAEADDLFQGLREAGTILDTRMRERDQAQQEVDRHRAALLEREQSARRAAEALNRAKDEFVATVSHELRTPLNAIFGWVALLKTGSLDASSQAHAIDVIDRNTRAQARLIEDLLDMSRVIQGNVRLDMRPLDLTAVLESVVESLQPTAEARQVPVRIVRNDRAVVSADQSRMQQVLWNLLANALKFTPSGGHVEAGIEIVDGTAVVRVTDSGQGIAPEFLPYVFERFSQEQADVTREHSGLGIGLSLVRYLTELHGGAVSAESAGKDQGSTFTLRLPLLGARTAEQPGTLNVPPPAPGARLLEGVHVLAVDDEADSRELLAVTLGQAGARVRTAASAGEAIAVLENELVDVVISDIAMPSGSGYDLVRAIRASRQGAALPVVAVTAYSREDDRKAALAAGFNAHLGKPFEPQALIGLLATLGRIER